MEERRTAAILVTGDDPSEKEDAADLGAHATGLDIISSIPLGKFGKALGGKASLGFTAVVVGLGIGKGHVRPEGKVRDAIIAALGAGKDIISAFSVDISKDEEFSHLARRSSVTIECPGHPTVRPPIATLKARPPCPVVLAYGKGSRKVMLRAIETVGAVNAPWISTTAAGCMMGPSAGLKVEVVAGDFVSGAIEQMVQNVLQGQAARVIMVECMGMLEDVITSPVTVGIVHGSRPTHILKVPDAKRHATLVAAALGKDIGVIDNKGLSEFFTRP